MIISDGIYAMLLVHSHFKGFTKKEIIDMLKNQERYISAYGSRNNKKPEVILTLVVNNRKEVDELVEKTFKAGAKHANDPMGYGYIWEKFSRS